ncbi:MAG TPA: KTSC domain-containing protein [Parafilimonas sp.]|nr:KTSC domain-containing protein [Parafilimonas sp.]
MPSTVVAHYVYDRETSSLRITFTSGKVYNYKNVPEQIYQAMKESFAKGIFFNQHIKDKYEFEKIEQ